MYLPPWVHNHRNDSCLGIFDWYSCPQQTHLLFIHGVLAANTHNHLLEWHVALLQVGEPVPSGNGCQGNKCSLQQPCKSCTTIAINRPSSVTSISYWCGGFVLFYFLMLLFFKKPKYIQLSRTWRFASLYRCYLYLFQHYI